MQPFGIRIPGQFLPVQLAALLAELAAMIFASDQPSERCGGCLYISRRDGETLALMLEDVGDPAILTANDRLARGQGLHIYRCAGLIPANQRKHVAAIHFGQNLAVRQVPKQLDPARDSGIPDRAFHFGSHGTVPGDSQRCVRSFAGCTSERANQRWYALPLRKRCRTEYNDLLTC